MWCKGSNFEYICSTSFLDAPKGLPVKINYYEDVDEPKFDPDIHIQLGKPEYVRCFPKFEKLDKTPCFATDQNGSQFAYSAPFQVTSIYNELVDELMS